MNEVLERHREAVAIPVNGRNVTFRDHVITGREALTHSGNTPASEYQLIQVFEGRTRLVGTDDELDLREIEGGFLRAFPSDRDWSFTVDEVGQVWGAEEMEVDEFHSIWPAPVGCHWVLERAEEPDTVLVAGGLLSFGPHGVEHVVSRKNEHPDKVLVTVVTTGGTYPAEGAKRYPASTLISAILADAARKLGLKDTQGWVVTVGGRTLNASQTLAQAGLSGEVALEWGAPEGGGGA